MSDYRVYVLDSDENIVAFKAMNCRDDRSAVTSALGFLNASEFQGVGGLELWERARLVGRLQSTGGERKTESLAAAG